LRVSVSYSSKKLQDTVIQIENSIYDA